MSGRKDGVVVYENLKNWIEKFRELLINQKQERLFGSLLAGGLLLGSIFMATDYVTSPMSKNGMLVYGVGIGILTTVIRLFGSYPEGMSFAILIMNAFTPLINSYIKPKHFGGK